MKYVGTYSDPQDIATKANVDAVEDKIPTKTSDLTNDSNYITSAQAPVRSVNNKTGAVELKASDVEAVATANGIFSGHLRGATNTNLTSQTFNLRAVDSSFRAHWQQITGDTNNRLSIRNITNGDILNPPSPTKYSEVLIAPGTVDNAAVTKSQMETAIAGAVPTIPNNLVQYTAISAVQDVGTLNADTLEGHGASYFATATGLSTTNAQVASLNSGLSTANNNISALQTTVTNKLDKSGGTMTGALVAQNNANYTTAQVRNVIISTADPSGGSNGMIWIKYTP